MSVDEYYAWIFEHSVPGLPERAAAEGLTPLEWMRRYGAFEIARGVGAAARAAACPPRSSTTSRSASSAASTRARAKPDSPNVVPLPTPEPDEDGRRAVGVEVDGAILRGWPTPSGRLEFYSRTLAEWGWPEAAIPCYLRSHVHPDALAPDQMVLISTFRVPVQIHTRSANAKWLDEIAHTNPLWLHPRDAERLGGVRTGELVRVETEIGHFVVKAWVTEGIRPGVVACSHHMGRWSPEGQTGGQRQAMATVALDARRRRTGGCGAGPASRRSSRPTPTPGRIWWTDVGVHQNLTFPVHPDPVSGMHCWHQAVRVRRAEPGDAYGDISVDTAALARGLPSAGSPRRDPPARSRPTARGARTGCCARSSRQRTPTVSLVVRDE